jgi:hypothetical protein
MLIVCYDACMRTINKSTAHKKLTTMHENLTWISDNGRLTIRKTHGRYVVALEDFVYGKTTHSSYATLSGALIAAETLKEYYL